MRLAAAGVLVLAALAGPAAAATQVEAEFKDSIGSEVAGFTAPVWNEVRVKLTGQSGDPDSSIFHGHASLTWQLVADQGTVFIGDAPLLYDVNGDGRLDIVVVQHINDRLWRLLVVDATWSGPEFLAEAWLPEGADIYATLTGISDLEGDGNTDIGVVHYGPDGRAFDIYSWNGEGLELNLRLWDRFHLDEIPLPQGRGFVRDCDGRVEFLVAYGSPPLLEAVGNDPDNQGFYMRKVTRPVSKEAISAALECRI